MFRRILVYGKPAGFPFENIGINSSKNLFLASIFDFSTSFNFSTAVHVSAKLSLERFSELADGSTPTADWFEPLDLLTFGILFKIEIEFPVSQFFKRNLV